MPCDLSAILETWLRETKSKDWQIFYLDTESFLQPAADSDLNEMCHFAIDDNKLVKCCNNHAGTVGVLDASDPQFFKKVEVWMKEEWPNAKR